MLENNSLSPFFFFLFSSLDILFSCFISYFIFSLLPCLQLQESFHFLLLTITSLKTFFFSCYLTFFFPFLFFPFLFYSADSRPFVVGTYHMPCMFKLPSVMMIHCALAAQHIQKYSNEDPYLLVGDFNIKPGKMF